MCQERALLRSCAAPLAIATFSRRRRAISSSSALRAASSCAERFSAASWLLGFSGTLVGFIRACRGSSRQCRGFSRQGDGFVGDFRITQEPFSGGGLGHHQVAAFRWKQISSCLLVILPASSAVRGT